MSNRDWLHSIAFGFSVVLGITFGLAAVYYSQPIPWRIPDSDAATAKTDYESSRAATAPDDAIAWIARVKGHGQKESAEKSPDGAEEGKDYHDALDLEAQWAAAAAGERVARLAVWQLVFGGLGIVAVGWSLHYTRKALELTRESIKSGAESAKASIKAAEAAEKSIAVTRESSERQLRAYISIEADERSIPTFDDKEIRLMLHVVNRGQTPAYAFQHFTSIGVDEFPKSTLLRQKKDKGVKLTKMDIGPGALFPIRIVHKWPFSQSEMTAMLNGDKRLYIVGISIYLDAFNRRRYTKFCLSIPMLPNGRMPGIEIHQTGNKSN